jgi:DNA polymerase III subunit delta'
MAFKDIPGNTRVKRILQMALERRRVPNSLLFSGPEGVGKKTTAYALAKALNCRHGKSDGCEECDSCRNIEARRHPDVIEISADRNVIKIEQMRFLKQMAYLKPLSGSKRVFIVEQAEQMNAEAANSLLKVLEEPPLHTHIVLITSNPFLLLPTIRSRCQALNFSPVTREEIERILLEKGYSQEQAKGLSAQVGGNLESALSLDWDEVQGNREEAWKLFQSLQTGAGASDFLALFVSRQRFLAEDDFRRTLEMFASFCRDILLIRERGESRFLLNPDYEEKLKEAGRDWSLEQSLACLSRTDEVLAGFKRNLNLNLLAGVYYSKFWEWKHV